MLREIATASTLKLVNDYTMYKLTGDENENKAMVTDYNTPYQLNKFKSQSHYEEAPELLRIQCSSNIIDNIMIEKPRLSLYRMGIYNLKTEYQSQATNAIRLIENAIKKVSSIRSNLGAYQNRLEHAYNINLNTHENTQAAESKIRDTDMASEMVNNSNYNILQQASQSMLAQANQSNQGILQLLQ